MFQEDFLLISQRGSELIDEDATPMFLFSPSARLQAYTPTQTIDTQ